MKKLPQSKNKIIIKKPSFYEEVYKITKRVPRGRITSYGRIAVLLGKPRAARAVGYALNAIPKDREQKIPWQRVINSQGKISFRGDSHRAILQRKILQSEGIEFDQNDRTDFRKFGWP
ncbi:methylated-DNA--[protein]-cysteine S-methyltransferase, TIGR00589 family [Leptospira inadai serovar Lyme str. 10]|uniref:Methylated-DNA--[protein]-cysteine S-methyltransferase, TIGR00589 family n=2 Tax=Leptospira inadai serovar Lyme TaxID=293084 RepID=V6H9G6_9LEPT|nr:MGMT family protein [Leptospira inadai]EQA35617.1 methylated-DNA--[protein]-cysteine S-methyltransferase, TIGR00589 family [Leptospira inadai serovar Lyme str. 10]PNV76076.1 cysteine methyltransferase [Leptospira inadai serovar Lyme]